VPRSTPNLGPTIDCVHHLRQHLDGALGVIELTPPVIGDVDDVCTMLHRKPRILRGRNALQDEWHAHALFHPDHVMPLEPHLILRISEPFAHVGAADDVALAAAVVITVDAYAQRPVAGPFRAIEDIFNPLAVSAHVELKDERLSDRFGCRLEAGLRGSTDKGRGAMRDRCARHVACAFGMSEAYESANRRKKYRAGKRLPEQRRGDIDLADIHQDALPQGQAVERLPVATQGRFGIRAARKVVPQLLRQITPRCAHNLLQRHEIFCGALVDLRIFSSWLGVFRSGRRHVALSFRHLSSSLFQDWGRTILVKHES